MLRRMLTPRTVEIIQSTVPVLKVHGEAITTRFYQRLFQSHPQLLDVFNHARQREGRQQAALANAVYAAAQNIARLEAILPAVRSIAHKHRSLGVLAAHYPIVGEHLLGAIREVLGEAATPEILGAWAEAYQEIASVFISVERDLYARAETEPGGWTGFRRFVVENKREQHQATEFDLRPEDGRPLATFTPGQYLTVQLTPPGEARVHLRQAALVPAPREGVYRVRMVRQPDAPSHPDAALVFLHEHLREGEVLPVSSPAGVSRA
jgi:nitric oxide dioxygenase